MAAPAARDGLLDVRLAMPKELGGMAAQPTRTALRRAMLPAFTQRPPALRPGLKLRIGAPSVTTAPGFEHARRLLQLFAELDVSLPEASGEDAEAVTRAAHKDLSLLAGNPQQCRRQGQPCGVAGDGARASVRETGPTPEAGRGLHFRPGEGSVEPEELFSSGWMPRSIRKMSDVGAASSQMMGAQTQGGRQLTGRAIPALELLNPAAGPGRARCRRRARERARTPQWSDLSLDSDNNRTRRRSS